MKFYRLVLSQFSVLSSQFCELPSPPVNRFLSSFLLFVSYCLVSFPISIFTRNQTVVVPQQISTLPSISHSSSFPLAVNCCFRSSFVYFQSKEREERFHAKGKEKEELFSEKCSMRTVQ